MTELADEWTDAETNLIRSAVKGLMPHYHAQVADVLLNLGQDFTEARRTGVQMALLTMLTEEMVNIVGRAAEEPDPWEAHVRRVMNHIRMCLGDLPRDMAPGVMKQALEAKDFEAFAPHMRTVVLDFACSVDRIEPDQDSQGPAARALLRVLASYARSRFAVETRDQTMKWISAVIEGFGAQALHIDELPKPQMNEETVH